jgi:hypothetical protein
MKSRDIKRENRKQPQKTLKEKRLAKQAKKAGKAELGRTTL